jgi:hypothetical protein
MALAWVLILGFGLTSPTPCRAAKISSHLTPKDRSQRELLDQNGARLNLGVLIHPHKAPSESTPTYVAFPLHGGEHLPAGLTTLVAGSQAGQATVGPLELDSTLKASLDAALAASSKGLAVVDTPNQNYLVEYLPRYARTLSGSSAGYSTWLAAEAPGVGPTTAPTTTSSSSATDPLTRLLNEGQSTVANLGSKSMADLEKLLGIHSSKPTATKPSLNLEAQVLDTPQPQSSSVPEPSTWLIFGLMLSAAGVRQRLARRPT